MNEGQEQEEAADQPGDTGKEELDLDELLVKL